MDSYSLRPSPRSLPPPRPPHLSLRRPEAAGRRRVAVCLSPHHDASPIDGTRCCLRPLPLTVHSPHLPPSLLLQLSFCNLSPSLLLLHIPIANMLLFCLFLNHPSLLLLDRVGPSRKLQTTQKIAFFLFFSSWRGFHRQIWYFFGCRWLR